MLQLQSPSHLHGFGGEGGQWETQWARQGNTYPDQSHFSFLGLSPFSSFHCPSFTEQLFYAWSSNAKNQTCQQKLTITAPPPSVKSDPLSNTRQNPGLSENTLLFQKDKHKQWSLHLIEDIYFAVHCFPSIHFDKAHPNQKAYVASHGENELSMLQTTQMEPTISKLEETEETDRQQTGRIPAQCRGHLTA